ncbi:LOW QUALITY PROTEIN: adhesion G-protein coupled receptor G7 [Cariama cristata]
MARRVAACRGSSCDCLSLVPLALALPTSSSGYTAESMVPPCFCLNGGACRDGACVCPEEWVGSLCETGPVSFNVFVKDLQMTQHALSANLQATLGAEQSFCAVNFCEASTCVVNISESTTKRLTFEQIIVGKYRNSKEKCEPNSVDASFSPCNPNPYNASKLQLRDHACVFWDYAANDWSTAGCAKGRDQFFRCRCNHTTNFAVLMAFQIKYKYAKPLEYISYIGIGLSMAGLVITILFQIFTRKTESRLTWMLVSLCFSMLLFNIIFISGIENQNARNDSSDTTATTSNLLCDTASNTLLTSDMVDPPVDSWCTATAVLQHYFVLATFMSTALNSAQLYLPLLRATKPLPGHFLVITSVIGWGIPTVVVAITLGATYREGKALNYRREEFCWPAALDQNQNISVQMSMLWSFLLSALIVLFNIIVFIKIGVSVIWKKNENLIRNKKDSFMKKMIGTISIVVVLGITWTIGYLMLLSHEETSLVFSYLFRILNTTQGLQICILYSFRSPVFKKKVSEVFPFLWVTEVPLYLHSKTYYVSKSQPAKHSHETFRSTESFSENIFWWTSSECKAGRRGDRSECLLEGWSCQGNGSPGTNRPCAMAAASDKDSGGSWPSFHPSTASLRGPKPAFRNKPSVTVLWLNPHLLLLWPRPPCFSSGCDTVGPNDLQGPFQPK